MLCLENFYNLLQGAGCDTEELKQDLENYLKNNLDEIKIETSRFKPKKTQAVERVLNRAFTQVLFAGRSEITLSDVLLSALTEKKSHSFFYLEKAGIDKEKFAQYVSAELIQEFEDETAGMPQRALNAFTVNLNEEVKKNRIDPVIGRPEELESIALALGRRNKNNVLLYI